MQDSGPGMVRKCDENGNQSWVPEAEIQREYHRNKNELECILTVGINGDFPLSLKCWIPKAEAELLSKMVKEVNEKEFKDFCVNVWNKEKNVNLESNNKAETDEHTKD